ncbi:hypothetical protein BH11ACT7_BH11ACT7_17120 [soil metagenome]
MTITFLSSQPEFCVRARRAESLTISSVAMPGRPSQLFITASGELDAGNVRFFADQVCALVAAGRDVCLDLSSLDFFAVDGCTALHAINAVVMQKGATWSVLPNPGVTRVLQLCDPAGVIPIDGAVTLAKPA